MKRIMAIDFGLKRTGIAISDELNMIASGLCTVNTIELMEFLKKSIPQYSIATLVVGQPTQIDGTPSAIEKNILFFIEDFLQLFPHVEIVREDERYTSKMAAAVIYQSGIKKKNRQNKALLDETSATIILQSYMYNN
jgi:putative Holliday junction resolvase